MSLRIEPRRMAPNLASLQVHPNLFHSAGSEEEDQASPSASMWDIQRLCMVTDKQHDYLGICCRSAYSTHTKGTNQLISVHP